jgi:hypothetical protein
MPAGERITIRQAPPTRASKSQIGFVKPFGPHHRHVLRICPRLEDEAARRIEYAGDNDLALCDVLGGACSCVDFRYVSSAFVVARNFAG